MAVSNPRGFLAGSRGGGLRATAAGIAGKAASKLHLELERD